MVETPVKYIKEQKERIPDSKIVVLGATGLVGSRFVELFGSDKFVSLSSSDLDITDKEAVKKFIEKEKPDFLINFAAFTDVDKTEDKKGTEYRNKEGLCWKTNVEGVRNILEAIDPEKTHFIQISTDYVFSASKDDPGPYPESHLAQSDMNKLTWYGFTKAEAERLVLEKLGDKATILRIIYPVRANYDRKLDYFKKVLDKYRRGKLPPLFTDQTLSITFIDEACVALARILERKLTGVFHAASKDTTTPAKLIPYYLERALGEKPVVTTREMGEWASRFPQYGGLKVENTEEVLGMTYRQRNR